MYLRTFFLTLIGLPQTSVSDVEKMKDVRDRNNICAAVFTDPPKTFRFFRHTIIVAKLHAFELS